MQADFAGLSETITAWQHQFLRHDFSRRAQKAGVGLAKTSFGSPTQAIEFIPQNKTFQAGGSITLSLRPWVTTVFGKDIQDKTGLGRWSRLSMCGQNNNILSLVTAYHMCNGSCRTAPLGSTFHRETEFVITQARDAPQRFHKHISARQIFLTNIEPRSTNSRMKAMRFY
jgi:hypothetical protein